jgi:membrane protease YdiL (CAAX protease family)
MLTQKENMSQKETSSNPRKKGVMAVWLFIFSYWALTSFFARASSVSQIPPVITASLWLTFIAGQLVEYATVLLFLFFFMWLYEKNRRSVGIKNLFSSVGWNKTGIRQSLKWAVIFLLILAPISLVLSGVQSLAAVGTEGASTQSATTSIPLSAFIIIIISTSGTAVTEETVVRGYILDRLMPTHPSTIRQALNAIIITSVIMMSYHAAPYLNSYRYSLPLTAVGLLSVFVYSIFVSFAYVRSRVRNASGPILFHFLLDAGFYIVLFALVG